jgi:hypothetical protein
MVDNNIYVDNRRLHGHSTTELSLNDGDINRWVRGEMGQTESMASRSLASAETATTVVPIRLHGSHGAPPASK